MFGTFRRHQNWIWIVVVIIVIPSFLYFFLPTMSHGGREFADPSGEPFMIAGKPVTIQGQAIKAKEVRDAVTETLLAYFIRSGGREWPKIDERLKQEAIYRVFLTHRLKDFKVDVSDKAVAQMARDRLGNYPFDKFEQDVLRPQNITTEDFERFSRNEAGIQQLVSVAALDSKLMTHDEAEFIYRKESQEVLSEIAGFWTTNYLDQVKVDPGAVGEFYTNSMARYRVPERIQVNYLEFARTNFSADADKQIAEITNLNARLDEFYFQQGTNSFKDTNGVVLSAEAAKAKMMSEMRQWDPLESTCRHASLSIL